MLSTQQQSIHSTQPTSQANTSSTWCGPFRATVPGPNEKMAVAVRKFYVEGQWKYVKRSDGLSYSMQDAVDDTTSGHAKVFIEAAELQRRETAGEFGPLFALFLSELTQQYACQALLYPVQSLLRVEDKAGLKPAVRELLNGTYHEMCDVPNKLTATTFFDTTVSTPAKNGVEMNVVGVTACATIYNHVDAVWSVFMNVIDCAHLCFGVSTQVFDACTTVAHAREAKREIMVFGLTVLSMLDQIIWATTLVGQKVGVYKAATRKLQVQDDMRGAVSQKDDVSVRLEHLFKHTTSVYETNVGRAGVVAALHAVAKQTLAKKLVGDGDFGAGGGDFGPGDNQPSPHVLDASADKAAGEVSSQRKRSQQKETDKVSKKRRSGAHSPKGKAAVEDAPDRKSVV